MKRPWDVLEDLNCITWRWDLIIWGFFVILLILGFGGPLGA